MFCLAMVICLGVAFKQRSDKINIWMIGDSTMSDYPESRAPLAGWGMPFASYFRSGVIVRNEARSGMSTTSFLSEKHWHSFSGKIRKGDFVMIQFGHNDEARVENGNHRNTPLNEYKRNLNFFISETREKGAIAILITPVSRMKFDQNGNVQETHQQYTEAVYQVAKSQKAMLIDLDLESRRLYQKLGPKGTALLFMRINAGEHPNYPSGKIDNTHFNVYGAKKIAELVLKSIQTQQIPLAK